MGATRARGREAELAAMAGGIAAAASGVGRLLVIEGAAGLGRTTLAEAALAEAQDRGMTVLRARGHPLEHDLGFGAARQVFAPLQAAPGWSRLCRGPAALAARALGGGVPPPASAGDASYAAEHGLFCLTVAVAHRNPAVLCVDDAHWADVPSLRWLTGVARRVGELPLALILTVRSGAPVADPSVLGNLLAAAGTVLTLRPLDRSTVAELIGARFPDAAADAVTTWHEASGGNPVLLTALLEQANGHRWAATGPDEATRVSDQAGAGQVDLDHGRAGTPESAGGPDRTGNELASGAGGVGEEGAGDAGGVGDEGAGSASGVAADELTAGLGGAGFGEAGGGRVLAALDDVARRTAGRLRHLPDGCAALAAALGVLGPSARLRDAAELAGLDLVRAAGCAESLRVAGLLTADGLAPPHAVIAAALDHAVAAGQRGAWHARAAALLAARGDDPERAAVHLLRTDPAGRPETAEVLAAAGGLAIGRGAPETAVAYLTRALAEPPADPAEEDAIRLALALAHAAGRREDAAERAHEEVSRIGDAAVRAEAALRCGRQLAVSGHGAAAIAVYRLGSVAEWATRRGPSPAIAKRARLGAGPMTQAGLESSPAKQPGSVAVPLATQARVDVELAAAAALDGRTIALTRELVSRCRVRPPPSPQWRLIEALTTTLDGHAAGGTLGSLRPLLAGGILDAETDPVLTVVAALVLVVNGDLPTARQISEEIVRSAAARGWPATVAHGRLLRSLAVLPAGLVAEAVVDARAAVDAELTSNTPTAGLLYAVGPLVDALVEADRIADADVAVRISFPGEPPPHALSAPLMLQSRARLRQAQNRPAEAIEDLRAAAVRWAGLGVQHPALATWRADLVEPLLAVGDRAGALAAAREHLALATTAGTPGPLGTALRMAALVAPDEQRVALLERAARITSGTAVRLIHAYVLNDLGSALRRTSHRDAARAPLRAALDIATGGGAHLIAARASAELQAAGARPRRATPHGPAALTVAERQVAALAAGGLTNREIAQRLLLSRRTVETHLAHAYHKLGITSRHDLAPALR